MSLSGILNLAKPRGMTSRKVVDAVDRFARPARSGHAGTLDPLAEGVLVVAVGPATRLIEYVQQMPKHYVGTFQLGRTSPTEDTDGEVTALADPPIPSREEVATAAGRFLGTIEQRPPAYSALKVQGRRAYDLARAGKEVDLAPRAITVFRAEVLRYEYPELVLDVECGSGTYVRSLGRDLAESLGTGAVMSALVRRAIGGFRLEEAIKLDELSPERLPAMLLPLSRAVAALPRLELSADEVRRLTQGQFLTRDLGQPCAEFAAFGPSGELVAVVKPRGESTLAPAKVFATCLT